MIRVELSGQPFFYANGGVEACSRVQAYSEDEPVVMIHGAGCDHSVWALQSRQLAQNGCRVIAVDLPRHGASGGDLIESIGGFADWLDAFLTAAAIERPVTLIGHSMGACIATTFAAKFSKHVSRLALLGAGHKMPVADALLEDTVSQPKRAHAFISAFGHGREMHFGSAAIPGIWNVGATLALLERCPPLVMHADFQACNEWNAEGIAENVTCPCLVITGSADRMTPPRSAKALVAALPDARLETIEGAGHLMLAEKPDEISRLLSRFTDRNRDN